jgi:purine catabolism regulator
MLTSLIPDSDLDERLTVAGLLQNEALSGVELIAGRGGVHRTISSVNVMSVPEIGRWVKPDEFLLATGYPLPRDDDGQADLLRDLNRLGLAGIGVKLDRYLPEISPSVIALADELGMPLVLIARDTHLDDILRHAYSAIVNRQAATLAKAQEIHESFLAVTLSGGGLPELARQLSGLLGEASVVITDQRGRPRATAGDLVPLMDLGLLVDEQVDVSRLGDGLHEDAGLGRKWAAHAIRAAALNHGFVLTAETRRAFGALTQLAVEQAAVVAALDVTRELAVNAVERHFSSNALYELMTGAEPEIADAATRGFGFGWDLDREVVVLVGSKDPASNQATDAAANRLENERALEFWMSAVHGKDPKAAAAGLGAELVAVVGANLNIPAAVRAIQREVAQFVRGRHAIGVSQAHPGPLGIPQAYQEARVALRVGQRISGAGAVTSYAELGLFKLLAQLDDDELQSFAEEALGPLMQLPEVEREELLRTLEALVENNMNMAQTARELHYHYNTLRYRLAKLERLLGPFSSSSAVAIKIFVSLQIRQMQTLTPS